MKLLEEPQDKTSCKLYRTRSDDLVTTHRRLQI